MTFISPHTMPESSFTASTLSSLIERAVELKRTHFACTDHGYLHSSLKAYNTAKKAGLKPILGIQFYFKDPLCDIVSGTLADRCKYFLATIYAEDLEAYQAICKLMSRTDFKTIEISEEKQNLLTWKDLEFLSKYKTNLILGGTHDLVGKTYISSSADVGLKLFEKLNNIFSNRLRVAIIAEPWSKKYARVVEIQYKDGSKDTMLSTDQVSTDKARSISASDLEDRPGHLIIKSKVVSGVFWSVDKEIEWVKTYNGFLPLPYDITLKINKFLKALADRYNVPVLVSDYAYYANKDDRIVQHVVLEGKNKIHARQHMKTQEEILDYLKNTMGLLGDESLKIINNNNEWAKLFDDFKLKYDWHLASTEGEDALKKAMSIIKSNGRMKWDDPIYVDRLKTELQVIAKNGIKDLTPYFLPIVEVLNHYKEQGHLTSVGRGSAGGSLFCYLLGITNIDPIRWQLPFNRFFSKTRIEMKKLPDIDTDLPQRETLVGKDGKSGFFFNRWGNMGAQVSTRQTVRLRSAIKDTDRYLNGKVSKEIEIFTESLPPPPQGVTDKDFIFGYEDEAEGHIPGILETNDDLKKFVDKNPEVWDIVSKALGITRAFGRHACISGDALVDCNGIVKKFKNSKYSRNKSINVWSSGVKNTVLVCLNNGISIRCTPDHKFMVDGQEIEAKDLLNKTVDYEPFTKVSGLEKIEKDLAFSLGWGLNDGTFTSSRTNQVFHFTPVKDDQPRKIVERALSNLNVKHWDDNTRKDQLYCGSKNLPRIFFESKKTSQQRLPDYFWSMDFESQRLFLRGFMSANGFVLTTRKRVGFKIASKLLANDICLWLNANGIATSAIYNDPKPFIIRGKEYTNSGNVEVNLSGFESRKKFYELIGFEQIYKDERLKEITRQKNKLDSSSNRIRKTRCLKIIQDNPEVVYDFNEPIENMGYINGILVHNCAYILSDIPISDMMPTKEGYVTHYEHKEAEFAGAIKYDFLTISQLLDIEVCLNLINKKNNENFEPGYFSHNGVKTYIWDLPEELPVYKSIWDGNTVSLFQINSNGMSRLVQELLPKCVEDVAAILALERPGPKDYKDPKTGLNMVQEYLLRRRGEKQPDIKELAEILPEAYGVMYFQEHLGKIAIELAGFSDEDAELLREKMAKKHMVELTKIRPLFIKGAVKKVSQDTAETIWEQMVTFGRYGFSVIHSYEYAIITYGCMFLRHNYPLEWWSAVLTNAKEKEITGVFYPHVKHLLASPDINLSTDVVVPDYANHKVRSKLGVIRGMGDKTIEPIVANRPYKDVQDLVDKDVCGSSLAYKLIHVGILDSLFKPKMSLIEKLKSYEDAVEVKKFRDKKLEADKKFKRIRALQPKEGVVPEEYVDLHPLKDAAMRKSVLPTMPIDLYSLGCKYSKILDPYSSKPKVVNPEWDRSVFLVDGPTVERLDKLNNEEMEKDIYVAATCYIIDVKEFSYSKGTKRALKLNIDCGGDYITEKVLWPDRAGNLNRPENLKKGCLATIFMRKSINKRGDMFISHICVEI